MPVRKRKYRSGKPVWYYQFDLPGSDGGSSRATPMSNGSAPAACDLALDLIRKQRYRC